LTRYSLLAVVVVLATVGVDAQQSMSADEKQIRDLIAAEDAGKAPPRADDRIFWSGAIKRPIVGSQQAEEIPDEDRPSNRVAGSQRTKTSVRRIEVAKAGDLAYEFSDSTLSYELKDGKKISFPRSTLRVWRKEAGQWRVAAHFSQPHYQEPAPTKR
jgi:ketosteroid isomerase-like protein